MEAKGLFTNFRYKSFFSPLKKKVCIEVSFLYHDKPIKRFIFIDKYPEVDYIQEAKRIIEQEINNGKLEKYCKRYGHNSKPALIAIIIIAFLVVIAGLGYLGYKYLSPGKAPTFDASITMSEPIEGYSVSLTNEKVVKGQPYTTNIKFTHPTEYVYRLPNALEKVSVGGIATTNYTYKISDPIKEATFTIPAEAVTGKVDITIKLEKIQPTLVDINGVNCVGCTVDAGQKAEFGASMFSFKVTLNPQYTDHEITKLAINNVPLTKNVDYQPLFVVGNNEFKISLLNGKKVDGTIEVTVTGYQSGDTKIELSSSDLWLCDTNDTHLLNNATMFNAADGCTVRLEMPQPVVTTNHVPLDIKVTAGNTLLNYGQYNYYFVDDEIAELVIDPIVAAFGDITITANSTPSIAQFIYEEKAGSVTLSFHATEEGCYLPSIDWDGTGSGTESTEMEVGKTYDIVHTFEDGEGVHAINVTRDGGKAPQLIGFNANNDIRPGANVYPDISAPLANYATGTSHIKSARIGNSFKGFIEEGIAYTGINSFCVPSSFTDMSTTAKHFANCANLDSIYIAPNNEQMCSDDTHKLLFTKVKNNQLRVKVLANVKSDGVILDTYNNMNIIGVEAFAAAGRTISSITFGQYCEPGRMDNGPLAGANVNTISVDSNNPHFIADSNNALVANNDGIYSVYATTANTKLEIYSAATNIHLLPYSIAVMQSVNTERPVTLHPYSVYSNSALEHFATGNVEFSEELTRDTEPYHLAAIYNCSNLIDVTLDKILSEKCLTAGLIQKCPNVISLIVNDISDYYGASTNTIYYADGTKKGEAIVVATCSASLLADPQTAGIDWYIKDFAPYVFNGNAFGANCGEGVTDYIYITKKVTNLSVYSAVGMSGNAQNIYFQVDGDNPVYRGDNPPPYLGGELHAVTSRDEINQSLYLAVLENLDTLRINVNITNVSSYCMVSDPTITKIELLSSDYKERASMSFEVDAFYNCPNLRTIDLSTLKDGYVPTITSTRAFIQPECTPFSPKTIKVIVNSESVDEFNAHSVWSQFNIVPANI